MARFQKYRLSWPVTSSQWYNVDAMFSEIYADIAAGQSIPNTAVVPGTYGSATQIPVFTVNETGNLTFASSVAIPVTAAAAGTLTGTTLAPNVIFSSLTTVGTLVGGATGPGFTINVGPGESPIVGLIPTANLGLRTATNNTFLRGDQVWASTTEAIPAIVDVQSTNNGMATGTYSVGPFLTNPNVGDTIVVCTWVQGSPVSAVAPTDTLGNTYTQIGTNATSPGDGFGFPVTWAAVSIATGSCTISSVNTNRAMAIAWLISGAGVYNGDYQSALSTGGVAAIASGPSSPAPAPGSIFLSFTSQDTSPTGVFTYGLGWNTTGVNGFTSAMIASGRNWIEESSVGGIHVDSEYSISSAVRNGTYTSPSAGSWGAVVFSFAPGTRPVIATSVPGTALTGTILASNIVTSSLTHVGTLATLTVTATITGSISGNSGSSTLGAILDDSTTNATMFPVWVTATPGNEAIKSSSSKLTWNPSSLSGSFAIGITPSLVNSLYVYTGTLATTAGTLFTGGQFLSAIQPPTNSTTQIFGVNATISCLATGTVTLSGPFAGVVAQVSNGGTSSGAVSDMRGFNASAFNSGASPTSTLYAAFIRYGMLSTGGITNAYGVYINSFQAGAGTITANMGVAVLTPTNGGPITTNLGIKIFGQGASGITHGYGLNILETTGAATTNVSLCIGVAPTGVAYSLYNASVVASLFKGPIYSTVAEADLSYTIATPVTLATVVMNSGQRRLIINPAGTIAVLTVTLPASPVDGQISGISFTQIVSALTVNAPAGATVVQAPTSAAVDTNYRFIYQASSTSWFPAA